MERRSVNAPAKLFELLQQEAREAGIPLSGAVDLALCQDLLRTEIQRYDEWLHLGMSGAMDYLVRGRDRRSKPALVFPGAKSIFTVALPYKKSPGGAADPAAGARYARYIQGRDYHLEIPGMLDALMRNVSEKWRAQSGATLNWKICVDTSAVLERFWAATTGLGWIGKNTLLINPNFGSYLFLGSVFIDQEVGRGPAPIADFCGNCSRCLDGCPTKAFTRAKQLDSNRCISYWTLEKRGALEISEKDRESMGSWIAGCDICQEVCPFNIKPVKAELASSPPAEDATQLSEWGPLLTELESSYRARIKNSSLSRVKPAMFRRNMAIALSNASPSFTGDQKKEFGSLVHRQLENETDESSRQEWLRCLALLSR